jgi:hypothetical protein
MKHSIVLAALAAVGLTACQTGGPGVWGPTWSEISGARYNVTDPNRFATGIQLVDSRNPGPRLGYGYGRSSYSYYKVDPGQHTIELAAINTTPNWVSGINLQNTTMQIEPCKRYYINAQFENRLLADWKPVVDYVEPIAGCGSGTGSGGY